MIILDTSIWIEFFRKKSDIFPTVEKLLETEEVYALECIFGELLQGAKNDRERDLIISYWKYLPTDFFKKPHLVANFLDIFAGSNSTS